MNPPKAQICLECDMDQVLITKHGMDQVIMV